LFDFDELEDLETVPAGAEPPPRKASERSAELAQQAVRAAEPVPAWADPGQGDSGREARAVQAEVVLRHFQEAIGIVEAVALEQAPVAAPKHTDEAASEIVNKPDEAKSETVNKPDEVAPEQAAVAAPEHIDEATSETVNKPDEESEENQPAWVAPVLEEAMFSSIKELSQSVMLKWTRSTFVKDVFRQFIVEDRIGVGDVIRIRDVYSMLEAMNFPLKSLVLKFVPDLTGAKTEDIKALADEILRRFAVCSLVDRTSMKFRDVYRLLEFIGYSQRRFLTMFMDGAWSDTEDQFPAPGMLLGQYRIKGDIGSGFNGVCCYMAEHVNDRRKAAVKWPVKTEELRIMKDIHKKLSGDFGVLPRVWASGVSEGQYYVVTDLLGSPLTKVFERLVDVDNQSLESRWRALCIIGRMMLRRLEAIHKCGYVHCDMSPENVLLGPAQLGSVSTRNGVAPYLIDFGLARKHPDGNPLSGDHGSAEWSSIRSADGGNRLPQDDLEALGWMLAFGFCGGLPWCEWLNKAYEDWDMRSVRENIVRRVRDAKINLLQEAWKTSYGDKWKILAEVPSNLDKFIRTCRSQDDITKMLNYDLLAKLLDAKEDLSPRESELEDLRQYQEHVAPLL